MAKPLRSDEVVNPKDIQFKHFGVMDTGAQSKASVLTSVTLNIFLAIVAVILGAAAKKASDDHVRISTIVLPLTPKEPPPEPPKPKIIPPKPPPKPPVVKIEPPRIKLPDPPKVAEIPKPPTPRMPEIAPVVRPAPPKLIIAPPAPQVVNLSHPTPASVINNSARPAPVALGRTDSLIAPTNGPAVSNINLGNKGMAGMPPGTGMGPAAKAVNLGNGSPGGSLSGYNGVRPVQGIPHGQPGGTGALNGPPRGAGPVNLGQIAPQPVMTRPPSATGPIVSRGPRVLYKPTPTYTAEARSLHLSGSVSVRIRVSSSGAVSVIGVTSGLGHGLDESALRAVQGTRFSPALDSSGAPIDWEGVVNVLFQLAE